MFQVSFSISGLHHLTAAFSEQLLIDNQETNQMDGKSQYPADWIGYIQTGKGSDLLEYRVNPDNPEQAGSCQGYQHRHNRISDAPQSTYHYIHHTA